MSIEQMGVVGAGQMGAGIAQVAAQSGIRVTLSDVSEERLQLGRQTIASSLGRLVKKEVLTSTEADQALALIWFSANLADHHQNELVVEAVSEVESLKKDVFAELNTICLDTTILASNTSSISITRLSSVVNNAERFIGMHFMNPVPMMPLVEIIRGIGTSDATYLAVAELAKRMKKTTVVSQDSAGFLVNRLLMPMINEAFFALMENVGSAADIDLSMKLGTNHPLGPLELADLIGLDTCLAVIEVLHRELGEDKYRPCPLLRKHVEAGWLGRKSGRGVFQYSD
ncbi:MAG: 3-hydroxybutyryl-CoA dehydrogenase [Planctomycetales bacterium]|nr:3-hydroxybutyryl-CoA dehydrogenase [Planctomycetales bacterium]